MSVSLLNSLMSLFKPSSDSGSIAKSRLKLVLVHDRANCQYDIDMHLMEALKNDIIQVIKKYMELDGELDIQISNKVNSSGSADSDSGNVSVLCANIPIKKMRKVTVN